MSGSSDPQQRFRTPTIEQGVRGPRGEEGLLLRAPPVETLVWDLAEEIVSARMEWVEKCQGWWIAGSYHETVVTVVLRSFPSVLLLGEGEDRLLSRDGLTALQERLF